MVINISTKIYKALSDQSRLRILNILIQRELCVCEIELILEMSQTNVSRHLSKLQNAEIVTSEKKSRWTYYSISEQFIRDNSYLYEHLKNSFSTNIQLIDDVSKLNSLKEQHAICEDIASVRSVRY